MSDTAAHLTITTALHTAGFHGDTLAYQTLYAASSLEWKEALYWYKGGVWDAAAGLKTCGCEACVQDVAKLQDADVQPAQDSTGTVNADNGSRSVS